MITSKKHMLIVAFVLFSSLALTETPPPTLYEAPPIVVTRVARTIPKHNGNTELFLSAMAHAESGNIIDTVNSRGMLGKYQFSPRTLLSLGFDVDRDSFLNDEALQDSAMIANMKRNYQRLLPVIRTYRGTWHNGIYITTSGILAGAHLVGVGGVLAYFYPEEHGGKYITVDSNGTTIEHYMSRFANYSITLNTGRT